jgi:hypothetical protein
MGAEPASLRQIGLQDPLHHTHQAWIAGFFDKRGNLIMILDGGDERSDIHRQPSPKMKGFSAEKAVILPPADECVHQQKDGKGEARQGRHSF